MIENKYDLDNQLERSVEWVKFAEAKNAVAIGLLGAAFVEVCTKDIFVSWSGKILIISLGIQIFLSVASFIPRFAHPIKLKKEKPELNFHYFGDISSVTLCEFQTKLKAAYPDLDETSKSFKDTTHQIHINCEIAMTTFLFFKWTCYLMFVSGVAFVINRLCGV